MHIVFPIGGAGRAAQERAEAPSDGFDGGEGIVEFVAEDAHETLPRVQFLLAQRAAEVRDHEQGVRAAVFAKLTAAHSPASAAAGKRGGEQARRLAFEAIGEADILGGAAEDFFCRLIEETLRGGVGEAEFALVVESEDRDIDLSHDGAQKGGRLEGGEALDLERVAKGVDLGGHFAQGVVASAPACAHGEIALAERGEKIGHRVERIDHARTRRSGETEPETADEQRERPLHFRRGIAEPQKTQRDNDTGQTREQRVAKNDLVVGEFASWLRHGEELSAFSYQRSAFGRSWVACGFQFAGESADHAFEL